MRRCFTLIELMVAVAVLAVLLAAVSGIFRAAGAVTAVGAATADLLAQAAAIERALRRDFEHLSREGFLAIRCVAVPNDVNGTERLLAPWLGPDAVLRADQIVFFTHGAVTLSTFRGTAGVNRKGGSTAARVYWGPAVQLAGAPAVERVDPAMDDDSVVWAIDPVVDRTAPLVPWSAGPRTLVRTRFQRNATDPPGDYLVDGEYGVFDATQPRAGGWLLARQPVILADDGGSPNVFLFTLGERGFRSTAWIGDAVIVNGRVDAAASRLSDIRMAVLDADGDGVADPWDAQREAMAAALFYPRAERAAPGMHRVDQALTNHVIAVCSSITIEWTPADGVPINRAAEIPWFGLGSHEQTAPTTSGLGIEAAGARVCEAFFGYGGPWPAAIRFTMTLHDPRGVLEGGRVFQFVVNLGYARVYGVE